MREMVKKACLKPETVIFLSSHQNWFGSIMFFIFFCAIRYFCLLSRIWCRVKNVLFHCRSLSKSSRSSSNSSSLHFSMSLNKNKSIRMWRTDQFNSIPLHSIHAKQTIKKNPQPHSGVFWIFFSFSCRLFVFISEKHLFCAVFFLSFCVIHRNVYICHLFVWNESARTHVFTPEKKQQQLNFAGFIRAFYFQTSRTSCHIMNINNDVTVRFFRIYFFSLSILYCVALLWMTKWTKCIHLPCRNGIFMKIKLNVSWHRLYSSANPMEFPNHNTGLMWILLSSQQFLHRLQEIKPNSMNQCM